MADGAKDTIDHQRRSGLWATCHDAGAPSTQSGYRPVMQQKDRTDDGTFVSHGTVPRAIDRRFGVR
jgi:hypothetical protein